MLLKAVLPNILAPVSHVLYEVKRKQEASFCSSMAPTSPLILGFMARATLQETALADQEFRNYLIMLIDGQIAPRPSLLLGFFQT